MALANATELRASVAAWLVRPDLTALVPDFIVMAESQFNRTLRVRQQETKATMDVTAEDMTLPNDFAEVRSVISQGACPEELRLGADYRIAGQSINFRDSVGSSVTINYFAKVPPLALNATNWLLTAYPDAYLLGSILGGQIYIQDDPRLPLIGSAYDRVIGQIKNDSNKAVWGGSGMAMRAA